MRVLAVDPGYERVGFAILERDKENNRESLCYSDCFITSKDTPFALRLKAIGEEMERLIKKYGPDTFAIEKLYFKTNQKTAMTVSETRGVFLYIAAHAKLPIFEYTPLQIKSAITGDGHGSKEQIMMMVPKLVTLEREIKYDDEYDAIAIGLTFFAYNRTL